MVAPPPPVGYDGATMHWIRTALKALLVTAAWGGLLLTLALPLARTTSNPALVSAGVVGHALLTPFCHQKVERSFRLRGEAMPLCTRCLGILMGLCAGTLGALFTGKGSPSSLRPAFVVVAIAMFLEWSLGYTFAYNFGWLRWCTGCALGAVAGLCLMRALDELKGPEARAKKERVITCTF